MGVFSTSQARDFYDRFGARQDSQAFYEDAAVKRSLEVSGMHQARNILEFGCGTGRFAEQLFLNHLSDNCRYTGIDVSSTMIGLSTERLGKFGDRSVLIETGDGLSAAKDRGPFDRIYSNYVLDVLSKDACDQFFNAAFDLLSDNGLLCLISLTYGTTLSSRMVTGIWRALFRVRSSIVGGCHPIYLHSFADRRRWKIVLDETIVQWGVPSEVFIARKNAS